MVLYISALKIPIKAISWSSTGIKITTPTGAQKMLHDVFSAEVVKSGWAVEPE